MKELKDIKKIRKKLGLTQQELASEAGISQSLIAKIESGIIDPSYTNARKILNTLDKYEAIDSKKAKDLMNRTVISCDPETPLKKVIDLMRKNNISQIPVMENKLVVGVVTETDLLDCVFDEKINQLKVRDVMQQTPPIITDNTPENAFIGLLKYFPLVIVTNDGGVVGIITKSDIINSSS